MTLSLPLLFRLGLVVAVLGAGLMLAALGLDWARTRARRSRRCPRCWYSMEEAPTRRCPECGHEARTDRHLYRSRRRWKLAAVGLVICATGVTAAVMAARFSQAWIRATPDWLLVRMVSTIQVPPSGRSAARVSNPTGRSMEQAMCAEIWRRYTAGLLSPGSKRAVLRRQYSAKLPPVSLSARSDWLVGEPFRIHVGGDFSGPLPRVCVVEPISRGGAALLYDAGWTLLDGERSIRSSSAGHAVGTLDPGAVRHEFRVRLLEAGEEVYAAVLPLTVRLHPTIDDVLSPVDDEASTALFRRHIAERLRLDPRLGLVQLQRMPSVADVTFAFHLIIEHEGEPVATLPMLWLPEEEIAEPHPDDWSARMRINDLMENVLVESVRATEDSDALLPLVWTLHEEWSITIRADPGLALGNLATRQYWKGEFESPVTSIMLDTMEYPEAEDW